MSDRLVVAAAALAAALALLAPSLPVAAAVALVAATALTRRAWWVAVALALLVGARAHESLDALAAPLPARVEGVAELAGDPDPGRFGTRVVLRLDGRRWSADVPSSAEGVVRHLRTGDRVLVAGTPRPFRGVPESWVRSRHLAGRLAVARIERGPPAAPWYRVANAVHRCLDAGAASFDDDARALYLGLVVGDDRGQSDLTRHRFRASGLSHLLAVSGQNVAFLLAVFRPVLQRCPLWARWWVVAALLALFVLITRAEPSVLRAAAMAAVATWASVAGRAASVARVLGVAVVGLLVVDPLLVHSTGFRLSLAATVGLLVLARPIHERLPGPGWCTLPLSVTLAAQVATAPVLLTFTDGLPPAATPANLLAVAPSGLVMVLGISVGLPAGLVRPELAALVQAPARLLVAWVDGVATWSSRLPLVPLGWARLLVVVALGAAAVGLWWGAAGRHRSQRRVLRWTVVAATSVAVAALCAPPRPTVGRHRVTPGVTAVVDRCGGIAVEVDGGSSTDVLEALRAAGITSADAVHGTDRWAVADVAEQLGAATGPAAGPCTVPP